MNGIHIWYPSFSLFSPQNLQYRTHLTTKMTICMLHVFLLKDHVFLCEVFTYLKNISSNIFCGFYYLNPDTI